MTLVPYDPDLHGPGASIEAWEQATERSQQRSEALRAHARRQQRRRDIAFWLFLITMMVGLWLIYWLAG